MSDNKSSLYSSFASHIRSELKSDELSRSAAALQRAAESRRRILNLHRSDSLEEEEARREIEDLIADPDIRKLNTLFRSPINILPSDMKYDEKAAERAREYFIKHTVELKNNSVEDFDAWRNSFIAMNALKESMPDSGIPFSKHNLDLQNEIEQCGSALRRFEATFSKMTSDIPDTPNQLNDEVHQKFKELSKIISAVNEFTQAKTSIVESGDRFKEGAKTVPASRNNRDIEELMCRVENLAFPTPHED